MGSTTDNRSNRFPRWILAVVFLCVILFIGMTRYFTEQTGTESHQVSKQVAKLIENFIGTHFKINRNDTFWKVTLDELVRKAAHFTEYALVGFGLMIFLYLLTRQLWIACGGSLILCFVLAYLDEWRQKYVAGRGSTWFDVQIDMVGAATGVLVSALLLLVYSRFVWLRRENERLKLELERIQSTGGHV